MSEKDNKHKVKKEPNKIKKLQKGGSVERDVRVFSKTKPQKSPKKK